MKRAYLLAVLCFLAIPFVFVGGGFLAVLINPEWAVHTSHYARNFHLLSALKLSLLWGGFGLSGLLWLLMCYFLVRSKERSRAWLLVAPLGPIGLAILSGLRDLAPAEGDAWQRLFLRMGRAARWVWGLAFFCGASTVAYAAMVLLRNLLILAQSLSTGAPVAQIIAQQNASSGMYAFTEGNEVICIVSVLYLFWPFAFNAGAWGCSKIKGGNR